MRDHFTFHIFLLAMLTGIVVYSYDTMLEKMSGMNNDPSRVVVPAIRARASSPSSEKDKRRKLQVEAEERMLEVVKSTWPECVNQRMNGIECKNFIDEEILSILKGDDRMTRTVLVGKRSILDIFYNSVVILMDDDDLVKGRDGDGLIYYDFEWAGSGIEATDEQQAEIPPIIATETEDDELIIEEEPVLWVGSTVRGALDRTDNHPIAGGVVTNPNAEDLIENPKDEICQGIGAQLESDLAEAQTADVIPVGSRELPPFDCTCLTGYACCLLIKATVRDADVYGKAIQCHLNFAEGTAKAKKFHEGRGKEVHIYTNHNFVVSIIPEIEGSWPVINETETLATTA